ncbi:MAG TPA: hypothetical protein VF062_19965 [Candidatus Limnocylindrales bacterium]
MSLTLIEAVALRALEYPYRVWGFGEGMALSGLLGAGELLEQHKWIDAVAEIVEPSLRAEQGPTDHLIPVEVLVELKRLRPALDIEPAVRRFVRAVEDEVHRPDLPGLNTMVWVDCMHTDIPGLLLAGETEAAQRVVERACAHLQDESGLFSHGYDAATGRANGVHWGRGQGWALHGLLAAGSPRVHALVKALERTEESGRWRTIVDDPGAPFENSVSAFVAACFSGTGLGSRALRAALDAIDGDGGLPVSSATPVGSYLDRDTGVFPWGQGPLLLALLAGVER